ncbi:acyl-CoA thioesterase [Gordonia hankookensis]|uniref:Thioesterase family protein n=1 Tax=Gordonia hankookensis TaxID=589403 RepID=A0ABR7WC98_9ACTN|nr:acyl-CoA thioesterase [Gordonia hankookensis]MBD1320250.1 thioesterase family protein [Gordonia hankookensis]
MTPAPDDPDGTAAETGAGLGPGGFAFVAEVGVRWSDMDAFGHINHARMVTLMEEARIEWLLSAGAGSDASGPNGAGAGSDASGPNGAGAGSEASGPNGPSAGSEASGPSDSYAALIMSAMIVHVEIRYQRQLRHEDSPLRVGMWIKGSRSVDFTIGYEIRASGDEPSAKAACVASTQMAVVDIEAHTLRRLTPMEKQYLRSWSR